MSGKPLVPEMPDMADFTACGYVAGDKPDVTEDTKGRVLNITSSDNANHTTVITCYRSDA
jgi:hypothetical protein